MPTGYTAAIKDGISFEEFTWNCARAFGALIMMRDDPASAPIPERFEPSDYNLKRLAEARSRLAELEALTPEQCQQRADEQYESDEQSRLDRKQEMQDLRAKYADMLDQVRVWIAPSKEHDGLKEFMIKQIEESIKFDCGYTHYDEPTVRLSGIDWLDEQKARAIKNIEHHKTANAEEVERTNGRNEWVRLLRESLAPAVQS
jgi:hypothetical protein